MKGPVLQVEERARLSSSRLEERSGYTGENSGKTGRFTCGERRVSGRCALITRRLKTHAQVWEPALLSPFPGAGGETRLCVAHNMLR